MQIQGRVLRTELARLLQASLLAAVVTVCSVLRSESNALPTRDLVRPQHETLRLYTSVSPASLNPLLSDELLELSSFVYDTLVVADAAHRLQPCLAREVPSRANGGISPDGRKIRFKLRRGVTWHDGQPFSSADVAFTFAKINDPKVNVGSRDGYDRIVAVTTPDRYTVDVTLNEPFAPIVSMIGGHYPIMPKHLLSHSADLNHDPIGAHPVGTGPYRFERWVRGLRLEYVANDAYFLGAPKIKQISVAEIPDMNSIALAFRTHAVDFGIVNSAIYAQLRERPDIATATEPLNDVVGLALNTARPILGDVRVRRAVSMAIDRARIAANTTFGTGTVAYADLPAALWTAREPVNPYGYNPQRANGLLDAAGWKRGPLGTRFRDGLPLKLQGVDIRSSSSQNVNLQIQQMLRSIGVDWSVKYFTPTLYLESKANGDPLPSGDFDTAGFQWSGGGDPENDQIYSCKYRAPAGPNTAFYCSRRMDDLQHDSLQTLSPVRRAADVVAIEKLAASDVPYVFLYHTPYRFAWNPQLHRTRASSENIWYDVRSWSFRSP